MTDGQQHGNGGPLTREFIMLESKRIDALLESGFRRQDELREALCTLLTHTCAAANNRIDERYALTESNRLERMAFSEKRLDSMLTAEAQRINALLAAAAAAVGLASTRAELTASALAERVDTSAKALAERVDTSARALATQSEAAAKSLAAQVDATAIGLAARIAPLEQSRYENAAVKVQGQTNRIQSNWMVGVIIAVVSVIGSIAMYLAGQSQ